MNDAQMALYTNVFVIRHNMAKGGIIQNIKVKNKITSFGLTSIAKLLNGDFNEVTLSDVNIFVPNYVAVGTVDSAVVNDNVINNGHSVQYIDRQLEDEYTNADNKKERLAIAQKNFSFSQDESMVTLEMKSYIMEDQMIGYKIRELGLFTNKEDNTCWARVILPVNSMFTKEKGEVVDIVWKVIIASV